MERKLIQLSHALVLSLPAGWLKRNRLGKGGTVEILEREHELVLRSRDDCRERHLDLRRFSRSLIRRTLSAGYRQGFAEFLITYDETAREDVEGAIAMLIGTVFLEEKRGSGKVSCVIKGDEANFKVMIRKCFLLLSIGARDALEDVRRKNCARIIQHRENLTKHVSLCMHLLQRSAGKGMHDGNVYFCVLSYLDSIGDVYFRVCGELTKKKLTREEWAFAERVARFMRAVDGAYQAPQPKIVELYQLRSSLFPKKGLRSAEMTLLAVVAKLLLELIEFRVMLDLVKVD